MKRTASWGGLFAVVLLLHFGTSSADLDPVDMPNTNRGQPICPSIGATTRNTRLQSSDPVKSFTEISGLALSPTQTSPYSGEPILFGVSDGGGGERLGLFDSGTGQRLLTLRIPSELFTNKDWESMAIGSCGSTGETESCLYIADIGDNTARTNNGKKTGRGSSTPYRILKIKEPMLQNFDAINNLIPTSSLSLLTFNYLDASSPTQYADCEALFIDHVGWGDGERIGDLYLVTKWGNPKRLRYNRLFKIPASAWPATMNASMTVSYSPKAIGTYNDATGGLLQHTWTGADATFDGSLIALGTTEGNYLFLRCRGATMAEALTGNAQPCLRWDPPDNGQVETISWTLDGSKSINVREGNNAQLGWTTMVYDPNDTTQMCPVMEWVETTVSSSGEKVRYCRTRPDRTTKPNTWCNDVNIVISSTSEEVPEGVGIDESRMEPSEESDDEISREKGEKMRRLRSIRDNRN